MRFKLETKAKPIAKARTDKKIQIKLKLKSKKVINNIKKHNFINKSFFGFFKNLFLKSILIKVIISIRLDCFDY